MERQNLPRCWISQLPASRRGSVQGWIWLDHLRHSLHAFLTKSYQTYLDLQHIDPILQHCFSISPAERTSIENDLHHKDWQVPVLPSIYKQHLPKKQLAFLSLSSNCMLRSWSCQIWGAFDCHGRRGRRPQTIQFDPLHFSQTVSGILGHSRTGVQHMLSRVGHSSVKKCKKDETM